VPECLATSKQLKVFNLNADMFVKLPTTVRSTCEGLRNTKKKGAAAWAKFVAYFTGPPNELSLTIHNKGKKGLGHPYYCTLIHI